MAITLTVFYGSPNAYNGAEASLGATRDDRPTL